MVAKFVLLVLLISLHAHHSGDLARITLCILDKMRLFILIFLRFRRCIKIQDLSYIFHGNNHCLSLFPVHYCPSILTALILDHWLELECHVSNLVYREATLILSVYSWHWDYTQGDIIVDDGEAAQLDSLVPVLQATRLLLLQGRIDISF